MSLNPGGLFIGPVRRPLRADSDFFVAGNTNRELLCKISVFSIMSGGGGCDAMDLTDHQQSYECMFQDCSATFSSFQRHEAHYETSHRNRCFTCGRSFPTHRLLDLHLSEAHDSFFKAMAERRPMYACLVEGCLEVFGSSGKRHEHLVGAHRYPESFDFSRSSYSRKKTKENRSKGAEGRGGVVDMEPAGNRSAYATDATRAAELGATSDSKPALATAQTSDATAAAAAATARRNDDSSSSGASSSDADRRSRRRRQALPISSRPLQGPRLPGFVAPPRVCKFWRTTAGCQAGSGCRFRHAAAASTGTGGEGNGGGGGDALGPPPRAAPAEVVGVTASARVRGAGDGGRAGGRCRPSSGFAVSGGDSGAEVVEGVEEVEEDASGGVDELISGMSKLMIPRHLRVGTSAPRGGVVG